ncbi:hypothetical protein BDA96_02G143300 [Sorghum bicolor]|uniref:No apical meristem-associated C-terminal domain-containing protein n=1 Tax=Sorghum bicolor TaxID=4558 RepID=A0A921RMN1_SORBI|nr:hypothetical protein BDA96_02G143300 [Sorghum bicolor]
MPRLESVHPIPSSSSLNRPCRVAPNDDREEVRDDRWLESKVLHEHRLSLEERKIANEEKTLWEQEQNVMFCELDTLDPSQKTYVIAMRAQIVAEKMTSFNNAFGGSSVGHEASGGGEI